MSFISALWQAIEVGRRESRALDAAIAAGTAGASPFGIARAFAEASGGQFEMTALMELERGMREAVTVLHQVAVVAARASAWEPAVTNALVDIGYVSGAWAARLRAWLEEPPISPTAPTPLA